MQTCFCSPYPERHSHSCCDQGYLEAVLESLAPSQQAFAKAVGFKPSGGKALVLPGEDGAIEGVLFGYPNLKDGLALVALPNQLPPGCYRYGVLPDAVTPELAAIAWADGAYRFDRYKKTDGEGAKLVLEDGSRPTPLLKPWVFCVIS